MDSDQEADPGFFFYHCVKIYRTFSQGNNSWLFRKTNQACWEDSYLWVCEIRCSLIALKGTVEWALVEVGTLLSTLVFIMKYSVICFWYEAKVETSINNNKSCSQKCFFHFYSRVSKSSFWDISTLTGETVNSSRFKHDAAGDDSSVLPPSVCMRAFLGTDYVLPDRCCLWRLTTFCEHSLVNILHMCTDTGIIHKQAQDVFFFHFTSIYLKSTQCNTQIPGSGLIVYLYQCFLFILFNVNITQNNNHLITDNKDGSHFDQSRI